MKSRAMSVLVYPLPQNRNAEELERKLLQGLQEEWGPQADRIEVLGFDARRMQWFEETARLGEIRYLTQTVLRLFGAEGEVFIEKEKDYQFLWDHATFEGLGLVQILHVHKRSAGDVWVDSRIPLATEGPLEE